MVAASYQPSEKAKVQGFMTSSSAPSPLPGHVGAVYNAWGWEMLN
jgi:hypothetical protein